MLALQGHFVVGACFDDELGGAVEGFEGAGVGPPAF